MEETILDNTKKEENVKNVGENNVKNNTPAGEGKNEKRSSGMASVAAAAAGGAVFGAAVGVTGSAAAAEHMSREELEPEPTPEPEELKQSWDGTLDVTHTNYDNMSYNDAFAAARAEVGPGGMFMYQGKPYSTFTADEYATLTDDDKVNIKNQMDNAMDDSSDQPKVETEPQEVISEHVWDGELDVAHTNYDNMSFNDAFAAARAEVGPGGMFMYHGKPYNTFYAEEYASLTDAEKVDFQHHVNEAMHDPSNHQDAPDDIQVEPETPETSETPVTPVTENGIEVPLDIESVTEDNVELVDIDGDGELDAIVLDTNNDDAPDAVLMDVDGDGEMDVIMDSNNDGVVEVYYNVNDNGYAESVELIDVNEVEPNVDTDSDFASYNDDNLKIDNDMNMEDYM